MKTKFTLPKAVALAALFLASTSYTSTPVQAGSKEFIGGVAVGVGGVLLLDHLTRDRRKTRRSKQRRSKKYYRSNSRRSNSGSARGGGIAEVPTSREQVSDYQRRLNTLGYDAGPPDGVSGPRTRRAVADFQASIGTSPSGRLTQNDIAVLLQQTGTPLVPGGYVAGNTQTFPSPQLAGSQQGFATIAPAAPDQVPGVTPTFPLAPSGYNQQQIPGTTTFPVIAAQPGNAPAAATATFPGITASSSGFAPAPAPATAFPTVPPGPATQTAAAPAFPAITGNETTPQADATSAFAALKNNGANTASPGFVPAAPEPAIQEVPKFAAVSTTGTSIDNTPAAMPNVFSYKENRPKIFGITPGDALDSSVAKLEAQGFSECNKEAGTIICVKNTAATVDEVFISHTESPDGAQDMVYLAARKISFAKPVSYRFMLEKMSTAYPKLLQFPNYTVTENSCRNVVNDKTSTPLSTHLSAKIADDENLEAFLSACPYYYSIRLQSDGLENLLKTATITFFDGASLAESIRDRENTAAAGQKQFEDNLDKSLKF